MLQAATPRGQQRPAEADSFIQTPLFFSCLCPWPLSFQPAQQPSALLIAWLLTSLCHSPSWSFVHSSARAWHGTAVGWLRPTSPAPRPTACPLQPYLSPLPLLPTPPHLPWVCPSNNLSSLGLAPHLLSPLPIASSLCSWPYCPWESGFISCTHSPPLPLLSHPLLSLPLQPPLLCLLTHPLPLPLPPSFSPTSLFQLRTSSSGQFPHRSASGEERAPPR